MSVYALKPKFQKLLRPLVAWLAAMGVTANVVTVTATLVSVLVAAIVGWWAPKPLVFVVVPFWLFVRMALNAVDGMLAREFHQQSVVGGYLNELGDVVSDVALYAPFALVAPFTVAGVALVIVLSMLTEFAGVLGVAAGGARSYHGPMGKSDRAVVFGAAALWVAAGSPGTEYARALVPLLAVLLVWTTVNRVRAGIAASQRSNPSRR